MSTDNPKYHALIIIGHEGIMSYEDLNDETELKTDEVNTWLTDNNIIRSEYSIHLIQEPLEEYGCVQYALEVRLPPKCVRTFKNFFKCQ